MLTDILGRPIKKGDRILTTGYGTPTMNTVTTVDKVAKVNIYTYISRPDWYYDEQRHCWVRLPNKPKRISRRPDQVVVITDQYAINHEQYPECYI